MYVAFAAHPCVRAYVRRDVVLQQMLGSGITTYLLVDQEKNHAATNIVASTQVVGYHYCCKDGIQVVPAGGWPGLLASRRHAEAPRVVRRQNGLADQQRIRSPVVFERHGGPRRRGYGEWMGGWMTVHADQARCTVTHAGLVVAACACCGE